MTRTDRRLTLANASLRWHLGWPDGRLRSTGFENRLTGRVFALDEVEELALTLSAATDRVQEPVVRVCDFEVSELLEAGDDHAALLLRSAATGIEAVAHYALDGPTRRKWVTVRNGTDRALLLLDLELDGFSCDGEVTGGGQGFPLFVADEVFAAVEYPSGENQADGGHVRLTHFPGRVLEPAAEHTSQVALVSVTPGGKALEGFVAYIEARCRRRQRVLSLYTPFGINNQWGPCSTLDDEETLHVLDLLGRWQDQGIHFDFLTLDTGWVDPASDLRRFRPTSYPNGPDEVIGRVEELGMQFGLWFATSWAAESCWAHPPAWEQQEQPVMTYRNGYPARAEYPGRLCLAVEPYVRILREAVVHHVRHNRVRFVKFDGGAFECDHPGHGHLPGKYSTERMHGNLIALAEAVRAAAPDIFIMWYWGLRSPFWALHGDSIFESGLHMEGSGTSSQPTLYYRDSVTLAQDQNASHARTIPPLVKDSLGVWLADTRWGNYMGKERWREAMVMDLGRGSLLFPNLWGDLYLLDEGDVQFLAWISALARDNEPLFLQRRAILGDPMQSELYGYAHCQGSRGFLFLNNVSFTSRQAVLRLDESLGLDTAPGSPIQVVSRFPEQQRLLPDCDEGCRDGEGYRSGDTLRVWLRPFEVLMLEVGAASETPEPLPVRRLTDDEALELGRALPCEPTPLPADLDVRCADEARFEQAGHRKSSRAFATPLPELSGPTPILAVAVRLRRGDAEWRYSPCVAEIVQVRARVGEQDVQLVPTPDARQFGNTQKAGCAWVVYKVRLGAAWSGQPLRLAIHCWLPEGVEADTEAWLVRRWWRVDARPSGDGYFAEAPS